MAPCGSSHDIDPAAARPAARSRRGGNLSGDRTGATRAISHRLGRARDRAAGARGRRLGPGWRTALRCDRASPPRSGDRRPALAAPLASEDRQRPGADHGLVVGAGDGGRWREDLDAGSRRCSLTHRARARSGDLIDLVGDLIGLRLPTTSTAAPSPSAAAPRPRRAPRSGGARQRRQADPGLAVGAKADQPLAVEGGEGPEGGRRIGGRERGCRVAGTTAARRPTAPSAAAGRRRSAQPGSARPVELEARRRRSARW